VTNTAQHTAGPWEVLDKGPTQLLTIHHYDVDADSDGRPRDYGEDICEIADNQHQDANAALIAAAPDTASERDRLKAEVADLVAALRSALAFVQYELELRLPSEDEEYIGYARRAVAAITVAIAKAASNQNKGGAA
jgi:hypothetical protein